jgi:CTP-dependent riboflavin kinase
MSETIRRLLVALMTSGAQSSERAIHSGRFAEMCRIEENEVTATIKRLVDEGYGISERREDGVWIYLTPQGVLVASSLYS